jgi:hypothetical protein
VITKVRGKRARDAAIGLTRQITAGDKRTGSLSKKRSEQSERKEPPVSKESCEGRKNE